MQCFFSQASFFTTLKYFSIISKTLTPSFTCFFLHSLTLSSCPIHLCLNSIQFSTLKKKSALKFLQQNQSCQGQNPSLFSSGIYHGFIMLDFISWIYNVGQLFSEGCIKCVASCFQDFQLSLSSVTIQ